MIIRNKFSFTFFLILTLIVGFPNTVILAQNQLRFKNKSAEEIIQSIEKKLDITFNFNHGNLPLDRYTFSCSGSETAILTTVFSILDRNLLKLDDAVFTIQPSNYPKEKRVAPYTIIGRVVDSYGIGLPYSTVWMPTLERAYETNQEGYFEIKGYFAADEKVVFRYIGYQPKSITIGQLLSVENPQIVLQFQQHVLGEIIITGQATSPISTMESSEEVVLLPAQIMPLAGKADKDILSIAQLLPGMYSTDESATEIQTRGGPPDQTNFEWNSIQLYLTNHFYGKISAINPFMVDRISIIKNGASAERSGQASGTIAMQDANITIDSLRGTLHSNLLYSNIGLNIPLWKNKAQLRLAWRKSYTQFFDNIIFRRFFDNTFQFGKVEEERFIRNVSGLDSLIDLTSRVSFQDLFGSLKIQLSSKDFLKLSLAKIDNQFQFTKSGFGLNSTPTDLVKDDNLGMGLYYQRNWSSQIRTEIQGSVSDFAYSDQFLLDPENVATTEERLEKNDLQQHTFQVSQFYEYQNWKFSTGYKLEYWRYNLNINRRVVDMLTVDLEDGLEAKEHSLFLKGLWTGSRFWQVEAGIRYSDYELKSKKIWEPRIHASFFPLKNWTLHAHYGQFHQALNKEHMLTTFRIANKFWILANETNSGTFLNVVENEQWSLGAIYQRKKWVFSLDMYKKDSDTIWSSAFDFYFENNPYERVDLRVKGVELSMKYTSDWFSLLWAYDHVDESFIFENGIVSKTSYSQPHRLSLFQALQWKNWQIAAHWKFASGRYFSEPEGVETIINTAGNEVPTIIFSPILSEQLPNYHSLDFSLFYNFQTQLPKLKGHIGCSISNIYNRKNIIKNEYYLNYNTSDSQITLQSSRGLPFTPNLVVEVTF